MENEAADAGGGKTGALRLWQLYKLQTGADRDETAKIVCRAHHIYYVSFFTINSWKPFRSDIFIHEMMHVWQFQNVGGHLYPFGFAGAKNIARL